MNLLDERKQELNKLKANQLDLIEQGIGPCGHLQNDIDALKISSKVHTYPKHYTTLFRFTDEQEHLVEDNYNIAPEDIINKGFIMLEYDVALYKHDFEWLVIKFYQQRSTL